jgi:hypothetical protein
MDQNLIALLSLLATFIALLLSAAPLRQSRRAGLQMLLLNDLTVLKALKPGSHHFERTNEAAARRAHELYFSLKSYHKRLSLFSGVLAGLSAAATALEGRELTYWTPIYVTGFILGFEVWRRSLFPNLTSAPPPLELAEMESAKTTKRA